MKKPLWWIKLSQYEYWHSLFFYMPLIPYWLWLSFRARSLVFFAYANPAIEMGGFFGESKKDIMALIPSTRLPKTQLIKAGAAEKELSSTLNLHEMTFPLVAKPNVGERGRNVEKIYAFDELLEYHRQSQADYLVQAFIDYPLEMGVLYQRLPGEAKGRVSSLTLKEFLSVKGDGSMTVKQLLVQSDRGRLQLAHLQKTKQELLHKIPAIGENVLIEPIGNHCRGTRFISGQHLLNDRLDQVFDQIAQAIPGFYFGRFDIKVKNLEDLFTGDNLLIMELNGVSSEPGHVYDSQHGLWNAYKDLAAHWRVVCEIACRLRKENIQRFSFYEVLKKTLLHFHHS